MDTFDRSNENLMVKIKEQAEEIETLKRMRNTEMKNFQKRISQLVKEVDQEAEKKEVLKIELEITRHKLYESSELAINEAAKNRYREINSIMEA